MKKSKLPEFIIIGAGKCGTTSLDAYLDQHPEIFTSSVIVGAEPSFFAIEGEQIDTRDPNGPNRYFPYGVTKLHEYSSLFDKAHKDQLLVDISPVYLSSTKAPERIKNYCPNVKLLAILRQPVDRLYSRYLHLLGEGRAPEFNEKELLDSNSLWWKRQDLIPEGFYYQNLKRYYELFPIENIKIMFYEDFRDDPKRFIREIYSYINVDTTFEPDLSIKYNENGVIQNTRIDKLIGRKNIFVETWPSLYHSISTVKMLRKVVSHVRKRNSIKPQLNPELKKKLTNEIYKTEIENLEKLIDKPLNSWF